MDIFLLILRLVLAGVFGIAGIAKAFDMAGTAKAFADFGVPQALRNPLVYILPAAELAVAVSLLFVQTSWYGAIGAAVLLLVFIAGMLYQFAKGNAPDCHCFGQIHSEPVGISSIVRNIILLVPAGILAVQGKQAQGLSIANTPQEILTLSIGIVLASLAFVAILYLRQIFQQQRRLMRQLEVMELIDRDETVEREDIGHPREGLPFGALVPDFTAEDLDGRSVTLGDIKKDGLPVLFLFVGATCAPCESLLYDFAEWEDEFGGRMKFVYITEGDLEANRKKFAGVAGRTILLQDLQTRDLSVLFRAKWTPMAVLMDRKGRIASFTAAGDIGLRELIDKIQGGDLSDDHAFFTGRHTETLTRLRIGEEMRPFAAIDINGREINSDDLKGKQALFTFWSPTCKYCAPMMEEIKAWDARKNGSSPELIVFADGPDAEEYKKFGLSSPVVWDPDHRIGNSIGQYGTPSAIMVDEEGRFITETAVGAEDIWALVGGGPRIDG